MAAAGGVLRSSRSGCEPSSAPSRCYGLRERQFRQAWFRGRAPTAKRGTGRREPGCATLSAASTTWSTASVWPRPEPRLVSSSSTQPHHWSTGKRLRPSLHTKSGRRRPDRRSSAGTPVRSSRWRCQAVDMAGPTPAWLLADHIRTFKGTVNRPPDRTTSPPDRRAPDRRALLALIGAGSADRRVCSRWGLGPWPGRGRRSADRRPRAGRGVRDASWTCMVCSSSPSPRED